MANDKKNAAAQVEFDVSKWLTPDMGGAESFREIIGLVPSYVPEVAFAEGWNPVAGFVDRIVQLPTQNEGTKTEYTPLAFQIILSAPNKGVSGGKNSKQVVDVAVGDPLLVFISGNLQTKRDLWMAAVNRDAVSPVVLAIKGKVKLDKYPAPMWDWATHIGTTTKRREGQMLLLESDITIARLPEIILLARGEVSAKDLATSSGNRALEASAS